MQMADTKSLITQSVLLELTNSWLGWIWHKILVLMLYKNMLKFRKLKLPNQVILVSMCHISVGFGAPKKWIIALESA